MGSVDCGERQKKEIKPSFLKAFFTNRLLPFLNIATTAYLTGVLSASLSALCIVSVAHADQEPTTSSILQEFAQPVIFEISRFDVLGSNPLNSKLTNAVLSPFLGPNRGIDDITAAAAALESKMRSQGLSFYTVEFPEQELTNGVVKLFVKRFIIGNITVRGNKFYSDENIKASLPSLREGTSPSTKVVARALTLANQNTGKRTRLTLAPSSNDSEVDATLTVIDQAPLAYNIWADNTGTDASGDFRIGASLMHRNLFNKDHTASLTFITAPEGVGDFQ